MNISRLESVNIRQIWRNEEKDFTPWLSENLDLLSESIGIEITLIEAEKQTGTFEADIFAEDENSHAVVIENQFGKSDHDHLGKLLTYASVLDAQTAIWICEDPRPEHEKAITKLNEITPPDLAYYLIKIEAYRISNSPPAPHFVIIARPSEEIKIAGMKKKELAERHLLRLEFWEQLLEKSKNFTTLFQNIKPKKDNWVETSAGIAGIRWVYVILMESARIELYIDTGDSKKNKSIFDSIHAKKDEIESKFNEKISWQRLDDKRGSRIACIIDCPGLQGKESWDNTQQIMIDKMIRFNNTLKHYI